jgi:hypothetical protein
MIMKTLVTAAFLAVALLSTAAGAQAASYQYSDYPEWAAKAFEPQS